MPESYILGFHDICPSVKELLQLHTNLGYGCFDMVGALHHTVDVYFLGDIYAKYTDSVLEQEVMNCGCPTDVRNGLTQAIRMLIERHIQNYVPNIDRNKHYDVQWIDDMSMQVDELIVPMNVTASFDGRNPLVQEAVFDKTFSQTLYYR